MSSASRCPVRAACTTRPSAATTLWPTISRTDWSRPRVRSANMAPRRSCAMPPSRPKGRDYALGVDIGGTFTDLALVETRSGRVLAGKVLTNYVDLAAGVLQGVTDLIARHGVPASQVRKVVHGTTLATNALIQRRGARTARIGTRGFRELLAIAH